jgi:uncharacterized protein GlcG (DUF336 family)
VARLADTTLSDAERVLAGALDKARKTCTLMNIAVVDASGNLKAFRRTDRAWLGSIDIAIRKARIARYFDMPAGDLGTLSQPGRPLHRIEVPEGGLITFPGGVPLRNNAGEVTGAVGVSRQELADVC